MELLEVEMFTKRLTFHILSFDKERPVEYTSGKNMWNTISDTLNQNVRLIIKKQTLQDTKQIP